MTNDELLKQATNPLALFVRQNVGIKVHNGKFDVRNVVDSLNVPGLPLVLEINGRD